MDLQHSCVVGVADPTHSIPPGHIFVTGALGTEADVPQLFVTRFPCTVRKDGLLLPLVTSPPGVSVGLAVGSRDLCHRKLPVGISTGTTTLCASNCPNGGWCIP